MAFFAERYSFPFVRKKPFACFSSFLRRARRLVPRLTRGIVHSPGANSNSIRFRARRQTRPDRLRRPTENREHTSSRTGLSRRAIFAFHPSLKNQAGETTGRQAPVTPCWRGKNFLQAVRQRETHVLHVRGTDLNLVQKPAHAARLLGAQQVALAGTPAHHFSSRRNLEALGGPAVRLCFQFLILLHDFLFRFTASRFNSPRSREVRCACDFKFIKNSQPKYLDPQNLRRLSFHAFLCSGSRSPRAFLRRK